MINIYAPGDRLGQGNGPLAILPYRCKISETAGGLMNLK